MRTSEMELLSPTTVSECLQLLGDTDREYRLLAGGTDAVVRMKEGQWRPAVWINIRNILDLRFIREDDDGLHIGPLATHSDIVSSALLQTKANVLVQAAREVGATQIQNMGTIGGNIANASPAGDTIPPLYVLDAVIHLQSAKGSRHINIADFFTGPGKTVMKSDEMIVDIVVQPQGANEIGIFEKLGPRQAQSISMVNMACSLKMGNGSRQCLGGKIAFGAVAPTVVHAKKCASMLRLATLDTDMIQSIAKVAWKEVMPISDVRASAEYRRDMASALLERGLYRLMERWDRGNDINAG